VLLGPGGAIANDAPGNAALVTVGQVDPLFVVAEWNIPPAQDWNSILVRAICATPDPDQPPVVTGG
jgi:hypothetical protein